MYPYPTETQFAVREMIEAAQAFDIDDIKIITETILGDDGSYFDPIVAKDLKTFMLSMFERGYMPGYCLMSRPVCDEEGPRYIIEFVPENGLTALDLINKPEKGGQPVRCVLHQHYKDLLKMVCERIDCTQDMMVRSILIKALDMINDQMK